MNSCIKVVIFLWNCKLSIFCFRNWKYFFPVVKLVTKGTKTKGTNKQVVIEEHISVIREPESIYVGYTTPSQGTAKNIEMSSFL